MNQVKSASKHSSNERRTDIRTFILGTGVIAVTHADAHDRLNGSSGGDDLFAIDINPDAVARFRTRFPRAEIFTDPRAMLALPVETGDVVIVATPPASHFDLSKQALESGRSVLCEKPLMMSVAEAEELHELSRRRGLTIGCCSDRYTGIATTSKVRELLEAGAIGDVYHMSQVQRCNRERTGIEYLPQSRWFLRRDVNGGGCLMDWGPYDMSLLLELFEPSTVSVSGAWMASPRTANDPQDGSVFDVEEHVGASLRLTTQHGKWVTVTYERAAACHGVARDVLEIEGTEGAITWDWLGATGRVTVTKDVHGLPVSNDMEGIPKASEQSILDAPLREFRAHLRGEASSALVNERAVFAFTILQAIYRSSQTGVPVVVNRRSA